MARSTREELEAAQERVAEGLRHQPEAYIQCRGLLHAWKVMNDFRILGNADPRAPKFLRRDLECIRECGVIRHDTYLLKFVKGEPQISSKVRAHYTYPEDYQIPGIPRGVKRHVVVYREEFRRAMEKAAGALAGDRSTSD